jgi:hypothetical protein
VIDTHNKRLKLATKAMKAIKTERKYLAGADERKNRGIFSNQSLNKGAIDTMLQLGVVGLNLGCDELGIAWARHAMLVIICVDGFYGFVSKGLVRTTGRLRGLCCLGGWAIPAWLSQPPAGLPAETAG